MKYEMIEKYPPMILESYYKKISGGIDGYYERMIINADIYVIKETDILAYFSVNQERGLTSLIVMPEHQSKYDEMFDFVMKTKLFTKILFTENDARFFDSIKRLNLPYEPQAYNFEALNTINTPFEMEIVNDANREAVYNQFSEFIEYNKMNLKNIDSFVHIENDTIICFGALEPILINKNRYALSMIVHESYRGQGYGAKVVQYLVQYAQKLGKEVNARCYVLNEVSKKTLLKSGLTISNMLYKVERI